ncbi:uncharacterized protein DUF4145 [Sphingomonas aerolata]|uniref:Uncharacterized protein DUF4145 n=1 Tax=Sphingomonas aerolata TaxID=185951 RepID=A0A2T4YRL9_9SPHN|nr:DUF4145 domain-containing protein [Sphingomonas aerolata]PTM46140.1 uncharacterized protein DUF4145 [Sphingomonas aerolata]
MVAKNPGPPTWICPHCNVAQLIADEKIDRYSKVLSITGLAEEYVSVDYHAIGCANPSCKKLTLSCYAYAVTKHFGINGPDRYSKNGPPLAGSRFLPKGSSKPQPSYVPQVLVIDYEEACAIKDLSPKASATLVRRCLQGMIRDFCGITKDTLAKEIRALREAVDGDTAPKGVASETVDAIDHVRSIGNIGAHMEKDINVIVDVDSNEAQMLIELVEMLFDEWYIARHKRNERLQAITALGSQKQEERKQLSLSSPPDVAESGFVTL